MDINKPIPPTAEELVVMRKKQEIERQERLLTYDDRIVQAKLHYFKGNIAAVGTDSVTRQKFADVKLGWNCVIMVGTERQMAEDDTIDNITGTYSYNLTLEMLKEYEANDKKLLII
jgi:hypothetical protein